MEESLQSVSPRLHVACSRDAAFLRQRSQLRVKAPYKFTCAPVCSTCSCSLHSSSARARTNNPQHNEEQPASMAGSLPTLRAAPLPFSFPSQRTRPGIPASVTPQPSSQRRRPRRRRRRPQQETAPRSSRHGRASGRNGGKATWPSMDTSLFGWYSFPLSCLVTPPNRAARDRCACRRVT